MCSCSYTSKHPFPDLPTKQLRQFFPAMISLFLMIDNRNEREEIEQKKVNGYTPEHALTLLALCVIYTGKTPVIQ